MDCSDRLWSKLGDPNSHAWHAIEYAVACIPITRMYKEILYIRRFEFRSRFNESMRETRPERQNSGVRQEILCYGFPKPPASRQFIQGDRAPHLPIHSCGIMVDVIGSDTGKGMKDGHTCRLQHWCVAYTGELKQMRCLHSTRGQNHLRPRLKPDVSVTDPT